MYAAVNLPELEAVLQEMAVDFRALYEANLLEHDRIAAGELFKMAATTRVEVEDTVYEVTVDLPNYWKYIDEGTKGRKTGNPNRKFPPFNAILKWVQIKPTLPRPFTLKGREVTDKQFAGWVGGKIMYYGTKGTHDLEQARDEVVEKYRERIAEALGHDALYYLVNYAADFAR